MLRNVLLIFAGYVLAKAIQYYQVYRHLNKIKELQEEREASIEELLQIFKKFEEDNKNEK